MRALKARSTSVSSGRALGLQRPGVVRGLDHHLVGADPVHPVVDPLRLAVEVALDLERREPVGHHPDLPARSVAGRAVGAAGRRRPRAGVLSSWPGQNGQSPSAATDGGTWANSDGRRARSVAMITQRPTMGSLRSSGMCGSPCGAVARPALVHARRRAAASPRPRRPPASGAPPAQVREACDQTAVGPGAGLGPDDTPERRRRLADAERAALLVGLGQPGEQRGERGLGQAGRRPPAAGWSARARQRCPA